VCRRSLNSIEKGLVVLRIETVAAKVYFQDGTAPWPLCLDAFKTPPPFRETFVGEEPRHHHIENSAGQVAQGQLFI